MWVLGYERRFSCRCVVNYIPGGASTPGRQYSSAQWPVSGAVKQGCAPACGVNIDRTRRSPPISVWSPPCT